MTYAVYKIIHLTGVMIIFLSLGGLICRSTLKSEESAFKKFGGITSAIGLIVVFLSGFGLIAKLGLGLPGWILGKLTIWFLLGSMIAVINRNPRLGLTLWWIVIGLGLVAAVLAITKPF